MKLFVIVCLASCAVFAAGESIEDCLKQDSISCVQKSLYRKAKEFFGKDNLELVSGVSLVKSASKDARSAKTGKDLVYDQEIDAATDVAERQNALENFIGEEVGGFLTGRSLKINLAPAFEKIGESARAVSDSVPQEIRQAVDEVVEGRGKKKMLKSILPLLLAAKVKIGALATLAYFGIALLAKKAILASLVSIAISAFIGLKALWSSKGHGHETTPYYNGGGSYGGGYNGGWSSGYGGGYDDSHAYAHNQAYSGHHH